MFGNISQILEMKKKADELKSKLEQIRITESLNGVTVDCNGNRKILAVHIDEDKLGNKEKLERDIQEVINLALQKAEKESMGDLAALAGGFPGLSQLFNK